MGELAAQIDSVEAGVDAPTLPGPGLIERGAAWRSDSSRLLKASRTVLSTPRSHFAAVLRLSRLKPPLPRAHHRRIAAAILNESARDYPGEIFCLESRDMVLLSRVWAMGREQLHPTALPKLFARLFAADVPANVELTTVWDLERQGPSLLAYTSTLEF